MLSSSCQLKSPFEAVVGPPHLFLIPLRASITLLSLGMFVLRGPPSQPTGSIDLSLIFQVQKQTGGGL